MYLNRYTLESGLAGCSAVFDIFMTTGTFDCAERLLNGMKVPAQLFRSVEYMRQQLVQRFEDTMSKYDNMFATGNDFTTCTDSNSASASNSNMGGPSFQTGAPTGNNFVPVININANANANIIINNNPTTNNITTYINNAIVMIGEGGNTNTFI